MTDDVEPLGPLPLWPEHPDELWSRLDVLAMAFHWAADRLRDGAEIDVDLLPFIGDDDDLEPLAPSDILDGVGMALSALSDPKYQRVAIREAQKHFRDKGSAQSWAEQRERLHGLVNRAIDRGETPERVATLIVEGLYSLPLLANKAPKLPPFSPVYDAQRDRLIEKVSEAIWSKLEGAESETSQNRKRAVEAVCRAAMKTLGMKRADMLFRATGS